MPSFLPRVRPALVAVLLSVAALGHAAVPGGTWRDTLQARDLDGDRVADAYYDTTLDLTWMADAGAFSGEAREGGWAGAMQWVRELELHGVSGWRLPQTFDAGVSGCEDEGAFGGSDCGFNVRPETSELAHMFFVTLGNRSLVDLDGELDPHGGLSNSGPFANLARDAYWSGTLFEDGSELSAWYFSLSAGVQGGSNKGNPLHAWAVRPGDVLTTAVPEPSSYAMLLVGLVMAMLWSTRHRPSARSAGRVAAAASPGARALQGE